MLHLDAAPTAFLWVSPAGSDSNVGSQEAPLATIQAAADRASPGTAVLVQTGTYHENVKIRNSGTEDKPIWFVSADGPGEANIVPVNNSVSTVYGRGTDNVIIRDFAIKGADHEHGIEFTQAGHDYHNWVNNLVIEGNYIYDVGDDGIKLAQARNVDVIGNLVSGGREESIDLVTVMNTRIINNEIRDLDGRSGITAKGGSTNIEIKGNYIHDVGADAVTVGGWTDATLLDKLSLTYQASQVTVEGNKIENVEKRSINFLGGQDSIVRDNFFDPQNNYFTAVNLQSGRWGLVSKNNEISDNVITRENWLYVHSGNGQGLVTNDNVVGGGWANPVGLDAYKAQPLAWLDGEAVGPEPETTPEDEHAPPPEHGDVGGSGLVAAWQIDQAFESVADAMIIDNHNDWQLGEGTIQLRFNADVTNGIQGLLSKDASYFGTGGHLSIWLDGNKLVARMQDTQNSHTVESQPGSIQADTDVHVALTFGSEGMKLYIDGEISDTNSYTGGLEGNTEPLVLGAAAFHSDDNQANRLSHAFKGTIMDASVHERALGQQEVVDLLQGTPDQGSTESTPPPEHGDVGGSDLVAAWQIQSAFDGRDDHIVIDHQPTWELDEGTIALEFVADDVSGVQGIFSKDAKFFGEGGHLTIWTEGGKLIARMQDQTNSYQLESGPQAVQAGEKVHVALTFGAEGAKLYVDHELVDSNDYTGGLRGNEEPLVLGGSATYSSDHQADQIVQHFDGSITNAAIYERALSDAEIELLIDEQFENPNDELTQILDVVDS